MKKINQKKLGLILLWSSVFALSSLIVFLVISFYSTTLVTKTWRYIVIALIVLFSIAFGFAIYLLNNNRHVLQFKRWIMILFTSGISLYVVGCSSFLFILYGPYTGFKEWLITTAMATMHHQHYCRWFYSDEMISAVMDNNYIKEFDEDTDSSLVDFNTTDHGDSIFDKDIINHNEGDLYKVIKFQVNGCNAYLAAVYDAKKISLAVTKWLGKSGQYIYDMATENNAPLAINGGGFIDPNHNSKGAMPRGVTIQNKKIISDSTAGGPIIGFNDDGVLMLSQNRGAQAALDAGYKDAVSMGPLLIVNGKAAFIKGNGGWGYAARTAIGQRADGIVLFLVVDSNEFRLKGATMVDLTEIMQQYGAINAANLDGGTSSVMVVNGEMINDPIDSAGRHQTRGIPTAWIIKN